MTEQHRRHRIDTKFIAHGGYSAEHPENTLEAYLAAQEYKPFAIEMDVVLHPDTEELICFHPSGVSSSTGTYTPEAVASQIAAGASFVRLKNVLQRLGAEQRVVIDLKQPSEAVYQTLLKDADIPHQQLIIGVRNMKDVSYLRGLAPGVDLLAFFADPDAFESFAESGGVYFRLWEKDITEVRVAAIQETGLEVFVTPGHKATETEPRTAGEVDEAKLAWMVGLVNAILVNDIAFVRKFEKEEL